MKSTHGHLLTAHNHFLAPQQHLYNGLARPTDDSISTRKWTQPHRQRAGLRPSWNWLDYGHHECLHYIASGNINIGKILRKTMKTWEFKKKDYTKC